MHDFSRDGIKLVVDGDYLKTDGTTLGADNGIAVAMGLALLEDSELNHPALELVVTACEEVSMDGAINLNPKMISGRLLINLDSEREGIFLVSCAGSMGASVKAPIRRMDVPDGYVACMLSVSKLRGGHSGADIDKGLVNSNRILSRALCSILEYDFYIADVKGGSKVNAILREAEAKLAIKQSDYDKAAGQ